MIIRIVLLLSISLIVLASDGDQTMELNPGEQQLMRICKEIITPAVDTHQDLLNRAHSQIDTIEEKLNNIDALLKTRIVGAQAINGNLMRQNPAEVFQKEKKLDWHGWESQ